jgi:hypothetical protein
VKKTGRDEPVGVVKHICIETTQENSLCSYLYLTPEKTPCFSFYLLCFFFHKIREQEGGTGWGCGRERDKRMNPVQIMYTHVYKCKNDTC